MDRNGFEPRRRMDGSIDTDFYAGRATGLHRAAMRRAVVALWQAMVGTLRPPQPVPAVPPEVAAERR